MEIVMDEDAVVRFLRCPASDLVDLAVKQANLSWKEELAITQCARRDKTQERAAEDCGYSTDAVQKWYRRGIRKLCESWRGVWWIERLSEVS